MLTDLGKGWGQGARGVVVMKRQREPMYEDDVDDDAPLLRQEAEPGLQNNSAQEIPLEYHVEEQNILFMGNPCYDMENIMNS